MVEQVYKARSWRYFEEDEQEFDTQGGGSRLPGVQLGSVGLLSHLRRRPRRAGHPLR